MSIKRNSTTTKRAKPASAIKKAGIRAQAKPVAGKLDPGNIKRDSEQLKERGISIPRPPLPPPLSAKVGTRLSKR